MNYIQTKLFEIQNTEQFNDIALQIFQFQYRNIPIYRQFVDSFLKKQPKSYLEIPFLPISFFKTHPVYNPNHNPELIFKSSGTSKQQRSQHVVIDKTIYHQSFEKTYRNLIGRPENQIIIALLPNYVEQGDSSLVYMVKELIKQTQHQLSGFYLNEATKISSIYQQAIAQKKELIIFGVSYALLNLAQQNLTFPRAKIIETGGMKGRRKELSKSELHQLLKQKLHVKTVMSEYGMTELLSQAYSIHSGKFKTPPWMKVIIRDINDPFHFVGDDKSGGINIIDLANIHSCSFVATDDLGKTHETEFEILGRIDLSDIRGCNLMIQ